MQPSLFRRSNDFSHKKVSTSQAVKVLKRNGIETSEDQAGIILDFLYLLAKTFKHTDNPDETDP